MDENPLPDRDLGDSLSRWLKNPAGSDIPSGWMAETVMLARRRRTSRRAALASAAAVALVIGGVSLPLLNHARHAGGQVAAAEPSTVVTPTPVAESSNSKIPPTSVSASSHQAEAPKPTEIRQVSVGDTIELDGGAVLSVTETGLCLASRDGTERCSSANDGNQGAPFNLRSTGNASGTVYFGVGSLPASEIDVAHGGDAAATTTQLVQVAGSDWLGFYAQVAADTKEGQLSLVVLGADGRALQ